MTGNSINMNGPSIVIDQQIRAGRTYILERIRDQRDILFGRFTDSLKKVDKERAWNQIALDAQMLGYFPNNRNGGYLRDTTWQNWRKRFVVCIKL
jgi:DNA repair photolyase